MKAAYLSTYVFRLKRNAKDETAYLECLVTNASSMGYKGPPCERSDQRLQLQSALIHFQNNVKQTSQSLNGVDITISSHKLSASHTENFSVTAHTFDPNKLPDIADQLMNFFQSEGFVSDGEDAWLNAAFYRLCKIPDLGIALRVETKNNLSVIRVWDRQDNRQIQTWGDSFDSNAFHSPMLEKSSPVPHKTASITYHEAVLKKPSELKHALEKLIDALSISGAKIDISQKKQMLGLLLFDKTHPCLPVKNSSRGFQPKVLKI
jgi:hypothetical protein